MKGISRIVIHQGIEIDKWRRGIINFYRFELANICHVWIYPGKSLCIHTFYSRKEVKNEQIRINRFYKNGKNLNI